VLQNPHEVNEFSFTWCLSAVSVCKVGHLFFEKTVSEYCVKLISLLLVGELIEEYKM